MSFVNLDDHDSTQIPPETPYLNNVSGISDASPGILIQPKENPSLVSPSIMKNLSTTTGIVSPSLSSSPSPKTDLSLSQLLPSSSSAGSASTVKNDTRRLSSISSVSYSNHSSPKPNKPIVSPLRSKIHHGGYVSSSSSSSSSSSILYGIGNGNERDDSESIRSFSRSNYKEENDILQLRLQQATEEIKRLQSLASDRHVQAITYAQEIRETTDHDIQEANKTTTHILHELNAIKRKMMFAEDKLQTVITERDTALEQLRILRPQILQAKLNALQSPAPHDMAVALLDRWRTLGGNTTSNLSPSMDKKYDPSNDHLSDAGSVRSSVSTVVRRGTNTITGSGSKTSAVGSVNGGRPQVSSYISPPFVPPRRNDGPLSSANTATNPPADLKPIQVARLIAKWNNKSPSSSTNSALPSSSSPSTFSPTTNKPSAFPSLRPNDPVSPGALLGRQGTERALQAKVNILMNELEYTTTKQVPSLVQHLTDVIENAQNLETKLVQERHAKEEATTALQQAEALILTLEKQIQQLRQRLENVEMNATTAEVRAIYAEEMNGIDRLQQELALARAEGARLRQNEESLQMEVQRLQNNHTNNSTSTTVGHTDTHGNGSHSPSSSSLPGNHHQPPHHHHHASSLSPIKEHPVHDHHHAKSHQHEQEIHDLQHQLQEASDQNQQLQESLTNEQTMHKSLASKYDETNRTNNDLKEQLSKAHTKLDEAFTDLLRLETRVNEKEDNLAELTETFNVERSMLRQQIDKLLEDREMTTGYVNEEVKLLQQQYTDLVSSSNTEELLLLKQINDLKEQNSVLRKRWISAAKELNLRNIDLIHISSVNKEYQHRVENFQRIVDQQNRTINELNDTLTSKTQSEVSHKRDIQGLQETIKTFNKDIDQRNTTIRHLQEALADSADRIPKLTTNLNKLREKHEKDKGKIQKLIIALETERKFRDDLTHLLQGGQLNQEITTIMNMIQNYDTTNKIINEDIYRSSSPVSTNGSIRTNL